MATGGCAGDDARFCFDTRFIRQASGLVAARQLTSPRRMSKSGEVAGHTTGENIGSRIERNIAGRRLATWNLAEAVVPIPREPQCAGRVPDVAIC
jgi:hypothetical protein